MGDPAQPFAILSLVIIGHWHDKEQHRGYDETDTLQVDQSPSQLICFVRPVTEIFDQFTSRASYLLFYLFNGFRSSLRRRYCFGQVIAPYSISLCVSYETEPAPSLKEVRLAAKTFKLIWLLISLPTVANLSYASNPCADPQRLQAVKGQPKTDDKRDGKQNERTTKQPSAPAQIIQCGWVCRRIGSKPQYGESQRNKKIINKSQLRLSPTLQAREGPFFGAWLVFLCAREVVHPIIITLLRGVVGTSARRPA